jgi:hypothetical protein
LDVLRSSIDNSFGDILIIAAISKHLALQTADVSNRKWNKDGEAIAENDTSAGKNSNARKIASRNAQDGISYSAGSGMRRKSHDPDVSLDEHVPHSIC